MDKKLNLKKTVDTDIFELSKSKAKSLMCLFKFSMSGVKFSPENGEVFICNKTSSYDKYFVSGSIESPHIFLKEEVTRNLYDGNYSKEEKNILLKKINEMLSLGISVVIFPEKHRTIFGEYGFIPESTTNFIKSIDCKINFISLIGTYFIQPVWSKYENKCGTKIEQRFSISKELAEKLNNAEFNQKFNSLMPSSASTYTTKYPLMLKGPRPAENLESIIYVCPACKKLFTLYSEYSCVKCSDCGTAFELAETGELSLTRNFSSLDDAKEFQKFILNGQDFGNHEIVSYDNIILHSDESLSKKLQKNAKMTIFKTNFALFGDFETKKVLYKDIADLELINDNILIVYLRNKGKIILQGKNKENFYILYDLLS